MRSSQRPWLGAIILIACVSPLGAQQPVHVNVDRDGLGLYGYDPVAYFVDAKPVLGSRDLTATFDGATYRFATAAHRDAFQADPRRYLPAYGGFCAYGVASGYKVKIDPEAWRIVEGRLYLNYDKRTQAKWVQDIPGYIAKAEKNWPELRDKPRK